MCILLKLHYAKFGASKLSKGGGGGGGSARPLLVKEGLSSIDFIFGMVLVQGNRHQSHTSLP